MAFCRYCGKKLEDGEVCSCRQTAEATVENAAPAAENTAPAAENAAATGSAPAAKSVSFEDGKKVATDAFGQFLNLLKAPASNFASFIRKGNMLTSGIIIVIHALLSSIFAAIIIGKVNSVIGIAGHFSNSLTISGVGGFFQTLAYSLILSVAFAGIYLGAAKILKDEMNFANALAMAAIRSAVSIPVVVLACVLLLINVSVGVTCFYVIGTLVNVCFVVAANDKVSTLNPNKKLYMMLGVVLVFVIVSMVFANLVSANYLPSALKNSFTWAEMLRSFAGF